MQLNACGMFVEGPSVTSQLRRYDDPEVLTVDHPIQDKDLTGAFCIGDPKLAADSGCKVHLCADGADIAQSFATYAAVEPWPSCIAASKTLKDTQVILPPEFKESYTSSITVGHKRMTVDDAASNWKKRRC